MIYNTITINISFLIKKIKVDLFGTLNKDKNY